MATESKSTPATKRAADDDGRVEAAVERLNASLDAAQEAAKALRKDVGRGRRDMARNVEKMITTTRRDAGKLAKAVRADLADLQKAVTSPPAKQRAKAGPTRARRAAPASTRKAAPAKRRAGERPAAKP